MAGKRPESARERAAALLGARPYSEKELYKKLTEKGETPEAAQEAVDWLVEIGALDNGAYASALVRHYSAKGYGPARIREEFYRRGIPKELWDAALEEMPETEDSVDAFLERKLRGWDGEDRKMLDKAAAALQRRGYGWDEIRRGLERYEHERNS